ncbi:MAG: hypothetical protein NT009_15870 [Proteobacteria bacterium]|nr:hypothetical protein [Pseudomonadota bacterium]
MSRPGSVFSAVVGLTLVLFLAGLALAGGKKSFREGREEFRKKIETKQEKPIEGTKEAAAVYFPEDAGKFNFTVNPGETGKLKGLIQNYFQVKDDQVLSQAVSHLGKGAIVIGKRYSQVKDGVVLKAIFLMPPYPYWERLANVDGIEDTFAVYNTSVDFYAEGVTHFCYLQIEGTFFGITSAIDLPVLFTPYPKTREFSFHMPTQAELDRAAKNLKPVNPGRTQPLEIFTDLVRRHPLFSEQDKKGRFRVSDKNILKIHRNVFNLNECQVKVTEGTWKIFEDYSGFYVVEYLLRSVVNVDAFVPKIPLIRGAVEKVAQSISDEVSVKYFPLSMKNLRDWVIADHEKKK